MWSKRDYWKMMNGNRNKGNGHGNGMEEWYGEEEVGRDEGIFPPASQE
jgi:hypothetical protein